MVWDIEEKSLFMLGKLVLINNNKNIIFWDDVAMVLRSDSGDYRSYRASGSKDPVARRGSAIQSFYVCEGNLGSPGFQLSP